MKQKLITLKKEGVLVDMHGKMVRIIANDDNKNPIKLMRKKIKARNGFRGKKKQ